MSRHQRGHVHQALRRATAEDHHALDQHPLMQRLTAGDLTREHYAESLAAMYVPHARLEALVHQSRHHLESGQDLSARLERLEADLCELALPIPPVSQIPEDPADGHAAWWGRVYVLEGSRQGGAFIAKRIHSSLGESVPCRFFGEAMVSYDFHPLRAMLERQLEDTNDLEQAIASAQAAFAAYKSGLDAFIGVERDQE